MGKGSFQTKNRIVFFSYLLSTVAVRRAHNPEVAGSKPAGGIILPRWRSRKRARLITLRSQDRSLFSVKLFTATFSQYGAEGARRAHNPEVTGSKPVAGQSLYQINNLIEHQHLIEMAQQAARKAHNLEVTGSKPVLDIIPPQLSGRAPYNIVSWHGGHRIEPCRGY